MRKRYCALISCCSLFALLVGCSVENNMADVANKKEQYAIIQNYEDGTEITVTPNHSKYDELVEKFTYTAMQGEMVNIPDKANQVKRIVFYQAPTKTVMSSSEDNIMKPLIEVDIYIDGDNQYAVGYLSDFKSIEFSFEMPEDLIKFIERSEN